MTCDQIKSSLALYGDGMLDPSTDSSIGSHLESCPVCRQTQSEFHDLRSSLRRLSRPEIPSRLKFAIRDAAISSARPPMFGMLTSVSPWRISLMPIMVGVAASLIIGIGLLNFLSNSTIPAESLQAARPGKKTILLASNRTPSRGDSNDIVAPADFASQRMSVSAESPSINPQGALVALTRSLVRGQMKDDEMVVVARVFGNGYAEITNVVEPSGDEQINADLQKAFHGDPSSTPFLPANIDNRGDNVEVVLKFQSVNVDTRLRRHK